MMQPVPLSMFPEAARLVALAGWSLAAVLMAFQCRGSPAKRWLTVLFTVCALHYATMAMTLPVLELAPVVLALLGRSLAIGEARWRWSVAVVPAIAMGFLHPVSWAIAVLLLISSLYICYPFVGHAVFYSSSPLIALLLCEFIPGFRAVSTSPAVFPVLVGIVVACQLWLPARVLTANGRSLAS